MAKHSLKLNLPSTEIANSDVIIDVFQDGKKHGTLKISKGAIDWHPKNANSPISLNWTQFDKIIKNYDLDVAKAEAYELVKKFVQD